jgi:hypothetical protein
MRKRFVTTFLAASLFALPVADAAARCLNAKERTAVRVRTLQTDLMVAALSCRAVPGRDFTGHYNAFVQRHGDRLISHSRVLQDYFSARYGANSRKQLDAFITAMANDASRRSMNSPTFCDESVSLFQEVMRLEKRELETWSDRHNAVLPVTLESCGAEEQGSSRAKVVR